MKINQIISEMTSGSVASVSMPLGKTQRRTKEDIEVHGLRPVSKIKSQKKKGPYQNSLLEGKMKDLKYDLDHMRPKEFMAKYGKSRQQMLQSLKSNQNNQNNSQTSTDNKKELQEDDLIIVPGRGRTHRTGFVRHGKPEKEGNTVKNTLQTVIRVATHLQKAIHGHDNFPEWVSEKLGAVKSNMVTVMDYIISEKELQSENMIPGGVIAGGMANESIRVGRLETDPAHFVRTWLKELPFDIEQITPKDLEDELKSRGNIGYQIWDSLQELSDEEFNEYLFNLDNAWQEYKDEKLSSYDDDDYDDEGEQGGLTVGQNLREDDTLLERIVDVDGFRFEMDYVIEELRAWFDHLDTGEYLDDTTAEHIEHALSTGRDHGRQLWDEMQQLPRQQFNRVIGQIVNFASQAASHDYDEWERELTQQPRITHRDDDDEEGGFGVGELSEVAKSKSQQRLFGMVHAVQKGKMKAPSNTIKKLSKDMTKKAALDYAKTKLKGLPEKVKKED